MRIITKWYRKEKKLNKKDSVNWSNVSNESIASLRGSAKQGMQLISEDGIPNNAWLKCLVEDALDGEVVLGECLGRIYVFSGKEGWSMKLLGGIALVLVALAMLRMGEDKSKVDAKHKRGTHKESKDVHYAGDVRNKKIARKTA